MLISPGREDARYSLSSFNLPHLFHHPQLHPLATLAHIPAAHGHSKAQRAQAPMSHPSLLTSSCVTYSHLLYLSGPQFPLLSKKHHNTYTSQGCCEYEVRQSTKVIQGQAQRRGFINGTPGVAGVIGRCIPHVVPSTWNL